MSSSSHDARATFIHDVFLSFRGEDTRATFISHLYASLLNAGIRVFKDDHSLQKGANISESLVQAIEASRISLVVFSVNYAESRWCLQELVKIMECHRTTGQIVLPVFYGVDPSEVRHQTGEFGKAFHRLTASRSKLLDLKLGICSANPLPRYPLIREYPEELRQAASLAGFVVLNSRNEHEVIKDIVENITRLLDKSDLFIADNPVGVESRVQDMIQLLEKDIQQRNDVLLLGMWGMGGVGKTTIAKAVYNKIGRNFDGRCFLANIREAWDENGSQVNLQERLLFDIFKEMTTKIQNTANGKIILRNRLCHKRVLIVLDDVTTLNQLNALCGSHKWFGSGSRIIITTRDRDILRGNRVNQVYIMKGMDESESIELFSWHAFKQASPTEDFTEISRNVVEYSGGLPLALEVLGSHLFDRGITEWHNVLEKLKRIPNKQVQKKLKISYDGLNDDTEKEIFLDIVCFFIGMDRNDVMLVLNGCGLFAEIGISILVERSLVTVDDKNQLGMHDLLRDMGREIVREKSPEEFGARCRLWFHDDVLDVLSNQSGTKAIKGMALKLPRANAKYFSTDAFKKMTRLRLLQLAGVKLGGNFEYLSSGLRWLSWNEFPLTHIPTNLDRRNLVSIELERSNVKILWKDAQMMRDLKILNLSHSHCLTHTPDFSYMPNLEKLVLKDCSRLSEISPRIEHLSKILLINLEDCISLCSLPGSIYKLKTMKTLILSGCIKIDKLEEDLEQMESLTTLLANNTAITKVPFSVMMRDLTFLNLSHSHCLTHTPDFSYMPNLEKLVLEDCSRLSEISPRIEHLSKILLINLKGCISLCSIPGSIYKLKTLKTLTLSGCIKNDKLEEDLEQMESLTTLLANNTTITKVPFSVVLGSKHLMNSLFIQMGMDCQVTNILKEKILQNMNMDVNGSGGCLFPGDSYPDWLTFHSEGSSVTFKIPQVEGRNLKTMMCIVYTTTLDNITTDGLKNVLVKNYTKATIQLYKREALVSFEDEERQRVVSSLEPGNKVEFVFVFENSFVVKKTAVYLIYDKPIGKTKDLCHLPDLNVVACCDDENECCQEVFYSRRAHG